LTRRTRLRSALVLGALVSVLGALMNAVPVTSVMAGHGPDTTVVTITAAYARELMGQGQKLVFVDLRSRSDFQKGRVPAARSIPFDEVPRRVDEIPRSGFVVLYCACPLKDVEGVYLFLRGLGYRTIAVMDDGFGAWLSHGYPIER
jgi:rhodanese-related sulfurtransferase